MDTVVEPTLTAATFDISNALADGAYERALLKLQDLLALQEDPILLLGTVAAQMRRLLYGRILYENGEFFVGDDPARICAEAERQTKELINDGN